MTDTDKPDYRPDDYAGTFDSLWQKVDVVRGGTVELRKHPAYLPQYPAENDDVYAQRLEEATFDNEYDDTLVGLGGMVFRNPPVLEESVPAQIRAQLEDADLMGTHFNIFLQRVFDKGVQYGAAYVLTDMQQRPPREDGEPDAPLDAATARALNLRPYCVLYSAKQVQQPPRYVTIRGARTLQQITFRECVAVEDGTFGASEIVRYRVWRLPVLETREKQFIEAGPVEWEVWEEVEQEQDGQKKKDVVLMVSGATTLARIPVRGFIANPDPDDPLMFDGPALNDLADLCLKDYQKQSNFEADLKYCVAVPWTAGLKEKDGVLFKRPWGRGVQFDLAEGGSMGFAEPNGNAFPTWEKYLATLKEKIRQKGLEIVIEGGAAGVATTATEQVIRGRKRASRLARWNQSLQDCAAGVLQDWASWLGLGDDAGGQITMGMSADELTLTAGDIAALEAAVEKGHFSLLSFLNWLKRAEILTDRTPEEEIEQIKKEKSEMQAMVQPALNDDGQPDEMVAAMGAQAQMMRRSRREELSR